MRRQGSGSMAPRGPALLDALFDPRSVTVVGASEDPAKWGHILSRRALESSGDRPVLLVNRRGAEVLGRPTHRTLAEAREQLGAPLDLVMVCVPADELLGTVEAAVAAGATSLVVITAGLSELGAAGARVERDAVRVARSAGAVLVGPNCLGLVDTSTQLQLSHDVMPAGSVAVLSQSGNVVLDLAALLKDRGLGVSRFVSLGNQADLTVVDLMACCLDHSATRAVAVYAEDVVDGRAFVAATRDLVAAGKPVVLLAPGRSSAAVRSAVSHTGSLTSPQAVVDAACAAAGAHRVDNPTQMADLLLGLLGGRRMPGRRAVVLTDGGGHGAIAADALDMVGLQVPVLSEAVRSSLRTHLWRKSTSSNPVDLAGAGERDPITYAHVLANLLAADEVEGVLLTGYFGSYSTEQSPLAPLELAAAQQMADVVRHQDKPVVVQTIHPGSPTGLLLRAAGIPVHRDVDRASAVLAGLVARPAVPLEDLVLPPAALPVVDASYEGARELFTGAGIAFNTARTVHGAAELEAAMAEDELTYPMVLKALGRPHKSEDGGVVLRLQDDDQVRAAYAVMVARLDPPAVSLESMVDTTDGVEVIAGCVRDPRFGPLVMVGLGGVFTDVLADTALAIAPVSAVGARRLLRSLRGAPLLLGARGRDPVDIDELSTVVSRVSQVAAAHPELVELELNPILASASGAVALDARIVLAPAQAPETSAR